MDSDLGLQLIAARNGTSQASIQTALVKRNTQSDGAGVDGTAPVKTLPAPPPGQGRSIDKLV